MKKYFTLLFILLLIPYLQGFAAKNVPFQLEKINSYDGGKLLIQNRNNADSAQFYFIKPYWADGSESIYKWASAYRKNSLGKSIPDFSILNGLSINGNLNLALLSKTSISYAEFDSNLSLLNILDVSEKKSESNSSQFKIINLNDTKLLLIGENIYYLKDKISAIFDEGVYDLCEFQEKDNSAVYISKSIENASVFLIKKNSNEKALLAKVPYSEKFKIYKVASYIAIVAYNENNQYSSVYLLDANKAIIKNVWVDARSECVELFDNNGSIQIAALKRENEVQTLTITDIFTGKTLHSYQLFSTLYEPLGLSIKDNKIFVFFRNGMSIFDYKASLQSIDYIHISEYFDKKPEVDITGDLIVLSSLENSICLKIQKNNFWYFYKLITYLENYFYPIITLSLLAFVYQLYRRQKNLLHAVLDLPSSGLLFVVNEKKRLTKSNQSAKRAFKIEGKEKIGKLYDYYCANQSSLDLKDFIKHCLENQIKQAKKINLSADGIEKEWLFSAIPLRGSFGRFRGFVFAGIDITEALERKRLANWAQLAHDMQTNLSAIKLNAEQLDCPNSSTNFERRNKILRQANILIQRVRDIVTVGRGGETLDKSLELAYEICHLASMEFDETVFPNIKIEVEAQEFSFYCDKAKLIRAIRNAIENGIKALPNQDGIILVKAKRDERYAYISIIDHGEGMDKESIEKMLQPYYSGSKNKGGFGIGSMIIQRVIELHGGELKITSKLGEGAEILIILPLK